MRPGRFALLLGGVVLALLAVQEAGGHATDTLQRCSTQLEPGVVMMGNAIRSAPSATVQMSRAGVALSPSALTYDAGETLTLSATGWSGEIAWEATGGATFTSSAGCSGRRSVATSPKLKMPAGGGPVTVWAGYASGKTTVFVTPKVTLTGTGSGDWIGYANPAPITNPPTTVDPAPMPEQPSTEPEPAPGPSPPSPMPEDPPPGPAPAPAPEEPGQNNDTSTAQTFAAYFAVTLTGISPDAFDATAAQHAIAAHVDISPSQVYILAGPSSSAPTQRRQRGGGRALLLLLGGRLLQSAATNTDLAIRITNLPDRATASGLINTLSPYLITTGPQGFASQYAASAGGGGPAPTVVLQSASATTYAFPPLSSGACLLDASRGLMLSWDVRAREGVVELQLEGSGEGWLGGGLTRSDNTAMVAAPSHKVLIADYATGGAPALVSIEGYEAASLMPVNATDFGVAPTLLQAAGGKLVLRYRQDLDRAASGKVDLDGQSHFMYAYSPYAYPNLHVVAAATAVHWPSGTCNPAWVLPEIEGYWLLPLLPLLGLLAVMLLTLCYPGPFGLGKNLLQRRLGPVPVDVSVEGLRGALFSLYNMKVGEFAAVLLYLVLQAALLLYWSLQAGPATARSAGIAFGKAALTNTMLAFLPVSKTTLWVRACGLPFERAVRFHRWLSYLAMGTMTVHLVCLAQPASRAWSFTPLASGVVAGCGTLAYMCFATMSLTAMMRRWCYEVFRYVHYLFILGVALVVIHAPGAWLYMIAPCALHLLDFIHRTCKVHRHQSSATLHPLPGGITRVDIRLKNRRNRWAEPLPPGAYLFVNIPALSSAQWHPISLSAAGPHGGTSAVAPSPSQMDATPYVTLSLHVRALGEGTWTHALYQLALAEEARAGARSPPPRGEEAALEQGKAPPSIEEEDGPLTVLVDGPYGHLSVDLRRYRRLVLFAGGIGITPITTTLAYIIHEKSQPGGSALPWIQHVTLVWAVREEETYAAFAPFLEEALVSLNRPAQRANDPEACAFDIEVYMTSLPSQDEEENDERGDEAGLARRRFGRGRLIKVARVAPVVGGAGGGAGRLRRRGGRPNVFRVMDGLVDVEAGEQEVTAVVACAPLGLLCHVQRQCVLRDVDLHVEEFAW